MENTVFKGPYSISLRPFYLAKGMNHLCIHQQGSKSSAKRETLFEKRYNRLSVRRLSMTVQFEEAVLPITNIVKYSDVTVSFRHSWRSDTDSRVNDWRPFPCGH